MDRNDFEERRLREEFAPQKKTGLDKALSLEKKMKLPALIFAYGFGIVGSVIFGIGMCLALEVLASGAWALVGGIIIGILGVVMISSTYPIFLLIMKKRKFVYGPKILNALDQENKSL